MRTIKFRGKRLDEVNSSARINARMGEREINMKKYTLTITADSESAKVGVMSENNGFSAIELLGLITWKQHDVIRQLNREVEPDVVSRKVIVD